MSDKKFTFNLSKTYLAMIEGSVGAQMFRRSFANDSSEQEQDLLSDGVRSCAFFVSSLLKMFDLIRHQHVTVAGVLNDLDESGWEKIDTPKIGAILVWDPLPDPNGEPREHLGFYVGDEMAISNSSRMQSPQRHHYTYGTENPASIRCVYWKKELDDNTGHAD